MLLPLGAVTEFIADKLMVVMMVVFSAMRKLLVLRSGRWAMAASSPILTICLMD